MEAAIERGRTPPVVTDWLSVSVGGTVSMGGFGFMSFHRGTQMDHLLEMEIETGIRNIGNLEVLSGLNEGDKIIAEGLTKVRPGMKVKPIIKSQ